MEEKERRRTEKGTTLLRFAICVAFLVIIWSGYAFLLNRHREDFEIMEDDFSCIYQIEQVQEEGKSIVLTGWAFEILGDADAKKYDVVLYDRKREKSYFAKMEYCVRDDVNQYFSYHYDYSDSGFTASFRKKEFDFENTYYEILLKCRKTGQAYQTGIYFDGKELFYINPEEYQEPEVVGTDLEPIVREGYLRVYRPDLGMYVYQYGNKLYWIAEQKYGFSEDGSTMLQYHSETTQPMRLPAERLENKWMWDNMSFYFERREWTDKETGKYRVSEAELPTQYAISRMWVGELIDHQGWTWRNDFRPYYFFD